MSPSIDRTALNDGSSDTGVGRLCQIVTPVGNLGYGFTESQSEDELQRLSSLSTPTAIILDAGSTDSGPSRLALGATAAPRAHYLRDIGKLVKMVVKYRVPLLISSAGGDGTDQHVDLLVDIIRELSELPENKSWKLKVLAIYAGVSHQRVSSRLQAGQIVGCGPAVPELTQKDIDSTTTIVAQMGPEPFLQAMVANPDFDIIIGGRSYDPSPYIAYAAYHALGTTSTDMASLSKEVLGAFAHMGKIMECGGQCAVPKSTSASAYIYNDASFDLVPLDPASRCIPFSVAAHCLYEKTRPDILSGPGGNLELTKAEYEQLKDDRTVRVRGATFATSEAQGRSYTVKLEGGKVSGYRTVIIGSFCDPILISQIYTVLQKIKDYVKFQHKHVTEFWDLHFHVYGVNESWNPSDGGRPYYGSKGVFVVGEAIAETQLVATSVASTARIGCNHAPYDGQKATSGNFGFGIGGKMEMESAACAEFSVYHLMSLARGEEGAFSAASHEEAIAQTEDGKPLFHWTETILGKGELGNLPSDRNGTSTSSQEKAAVKTKDSSTPVAQPFQIGSNPRTLGDTATVFRSKNAGPYEITIDVLFPTKEIYDAIKSSGVISAEVVARLYDLAVDELIWCGFFDPALAFKVTFPRKRNGKLTPSGGYMEADMHGSQQYLPLMEIPLDASLVQQLQGVAKVGTSNDK